MRKPISFGFGALKTFDELMDQSKIKELEPFITREIINKYDKQNLLPHYIIHGTKGYKTDEVIRWVKQELVEHYDGFNIISKFYSFDTENVKEATDIPRELIKHSGDLFEYSLFFTPCVYFLLDNVEIVYVGQSINISARVHQHLIDKCFNRVLYLPVVKENLLKVERFFIERLKPKYNKEGFLVHNRMEYEKETYDSLLEKLNKKENDEDKYN